MRGMHGGTMLVVSGITWRLNVSVDVATLYREGVSQGIGSWDGTNLLGFDKIPGAPVRELEQEMLKAKDAGRKAEMRATNRPSLLLFK